MSKLNLSELALPQTMIEVDGIEYMVEAMPATFALEFMEKYQQAIDSGKSDLRTMKEVICKTVYKDNKLIDSKRFDTIFARKLAHLSKLYQAVLEYNMADVFTEPDSED